MLLKNIHFVQLRQINKSDNIGYNISSNFREPEIVPTLTSSGEQMPLITARKRGKKFANRNDGIYEIATAITSMSKYFSTSESFDDEAMVRRTHVVYVAK